MSLDHEEIYLIDGPFETIKGIVNFHPYRGSHWVLYINECFFDSFGFGRPQKLSEFITKRNGYCLHSENKKQGLTSKRDSYCASYCLYFFT